MEIITAGIMPLVIYSILFLLIGLCVNLPHEDYHNKDEGYGFGVTLFTLITVWYIVVQTGIQHPMALLIENKLLIILLGIAYFIIGTVWSIFKWKLIVSKLKERAIKDMSILSLQKPVASDYSSTIIMWIAYWPVSFLWYFLSNPFVVIGRYIYSKISKVFDSITDSAWVEVDALEETKKADKLDKKNEKSSRNVEQLNG